MSETFESILAVFLVSLSIAVVVLVIYLAQLLKQTTQTMKSIQELTDLTTNELKPALKSVNNVLKTVDNVSIATNKQFDLVKKILTTLLGASCIALTNVKSKGGFFSGLINGFNLFRKRR